MHNSKLIRIQKYESRITNLLNDFINKEIYNPKLKFAKIMYVRLSSDYSALKIFVDCLEQDKLDSLVEKLNDNSNIFRTHLAHNFDFKRAPSVKFLKDETMSRVQEIEDILNNIKNKG